MLMLSDWSTTERILTIHCGGQTNIDNMNKKKWAIILETWAHLSLSVYIWALDVLKMIRWDKEMTSSVSHLLIRFWRIKLIVKS